MGLTSRADACSDPTATFDRRCNAYVGGVVFNAEGGLFPASAILVSKSSAKFAGTFLHAPDDGDRMPESLRPPSYGARISVGDGPLSGDGVKGGFAMADRWLFRSETYDNCNCAMNCGCQFNLPSTHGYCHSAYVGTVVEGHFNETPLAGLKWAGLWKWPGEIAAGNGTRLIVIDERANQAQRVALETIISGEACVRLSNVFSVYGSLCEHFLDTLFLPIELEADFENRTATANIPGVLTSRARPLTNEFSGEPFHIALARPSGSVEFTYADLALGTTTVSGQLDMAFSNSFAMFCVHHFNQDGLVRERPRIMKWLDARRR